MLFNLFWIFFPTFLGLTVICGTDTLKATNRVRLITEMVMPLKPLIQRMQIQQQPEKQNTKSFQSKPFLTRSCTQLALLIYCINVHLLMWSKIRKRRGQSSTRRQATSNNGKDKDDDNKYLGLLQGGMSHFLNLLKSCLEKSPESLLMNC